MRGGSSSHEVRGPVGSVQGPLEGGIKSRYDQDSLYTYMPNPTSKFLTSFYSFFFKLTSLSVLT